MESQEYIRDSTADKKLNAHIGLKQRRYVGSMQPARQVLDIE